MFDLKNAKKVEGEKKDSLQSRREKKVCTNLWGLWSDPYGARLVPGLKPLSLPRAHYVASSPGSPRPYLLDGHRKLVGCSAIPARSCPVGDDSLSPGSLRVSPPAPYSRTWYLFSLSESSFFEAEREALLCRWLT